MGRAGRPEGVPVLSPLSTGLAGACGTGILSIARARWVVQTAVDGQSQLTGIALVVEPLKLRLPLGSQRAAVDEALERLAAAARAWQAPWPGQSGSWIIGQTQSRHPLPFALQWPALARGVWVGLRMPDGVDD